MRKMNNIHLASPRPWKKLGFCLSIVFTFLAVIAGEMPKSTSRAGLLGPGVVPASLAQVMVQRSIFREGESICCLVVGASQSLC